MPDAPVEPQKSFMIQKQITDPTHQPLELYHLAHDLRGPLNSILGFTELLLEGIEGPLNDTQQADMAAIHQSARNLLLLINSVVDLSKLEADRLSLTLAPVNLVQVLQNVLASEVITGRPEGVQLVTSIPAGLPPAVGDQERLEQVLLNFVRFILKSQKQGQLSLGADSDDREITLWVKSDSLTVPAGDRLGLFDLSVKIDAAGRSELGRGGLLLPLARCLAEKHGGRVWAESQEGAGTAFYLQLPAQAQT